MGISQDASVEERFRKHTAPKGECVVWTRLPASGAGPLFTLNGRQQPVRRVAWQLENGPLSSAYCVVSRCGTPHCVRIEHLEAVDRVEAQRRMLQVELDRRANVPTFRCGHAKSLADRSLSYSGCTICQRKAKREYARDVIVPRRRARSIPRPSLDELGRRFWSKVQKTEGDQCWLWTGARNSGGYPTLNIGYKQTPASRIALELTVGPEPEPGRYACHHCDNPSCVRPEHLYWGTPRDNSHDAMRRGRMRHYFQPGHYVPPADTEKLFFEKTQQEASGCLLWTGYVTRTYGYGLFRYQGKSQPAHRVAWQLVYGPIPPGMKVRHRCGHAACVAVDHLYLG